MQWNPISSLPPPPETNAYIDGATVILISNGKYVSIIQPEYDCEEETYIWKLVDSELPIDTHYKPTHWIEIQLPET